MKRLALLFLVFPICAQAIPILYDVTFDADIGPDGTGSFIFDNDIGELSGFCWDFGDGIVGGITDVLNGDAAGDTWGRLLFEIFSGVDVHSGADCTNGCSFSTTSLLGLSPGNATLFSVFSNFWWMPSGGDEMYTFRDSSHAIVAEGLLLVAVATVPEPGQFNDVPAEYWANSSIETLVRNGITAGCGNGNYCPNDPVTRAQLAVFIERGMRASNCDPDAASGNVFLDVGANDFAASFIERLYADGITAGCGNNNYCPDANVSRAHMAVFLLRAKYGPSYSPPAATGIFNDVGVNDFGADFIEQLSVEGITSGCGNGSYCPEAPVTRAQIAVLLVRTFGLQ